ncbi:MAG: hypothetical protein NWF01_12000 [Candidatus Bathyarchaeota archaeon]|nr:hypothetical protein [Candidatus Bathyarchaeota archaeon]
MTLIEYNTNQTLNTTINLPSDGLLRGVGSKQIVITSTANPIISVNSNLAENYKSAVIENVILCGNTSNIGILLENIYNCQVRNVTIVNCDIGIKLISSDGGWSQSNHIQHVRMSYVNKGIQFAPGATNNFGFTHIEDVGISLNDTANLRGIEIGTGCKPYASFIKANVWSSQACTGMWVDGEIKYCLINFNHEKCTAGAGGNGIYLGPNASIGSNINQSFFLAAGNLSTAVSNPYSKANDIVSKTY